MRGTACRGESGRRFRLEGTDAPRFHRVSRRAIEDGVSDIDVDAELSGAKSESTSDQARDLLIETLREADGKMESDALDAAVAAATGLKARSVRNLRIDMNTKGGCARSRRRTRREQLPPGTRLSRMLRARARVPPLAGVWNLGLWTI